MKSALQMMYELVAIRSDTGTKSEREVAQKLLDLIKEDEYFKEHPDLFGAYLDNDILGRPVIWALKKGSSSRTMIISGHYDCVETTCYGPLQEYALDPCNLRAHIASHLSADHRVKSDLTDPDWVFGRGTADMKGGLAAGLFAFLNYSGGEASVLFTAVSDEENLSAGARQAVGLYTALKERYGLDYRLCVIPEPSGRNPERGEPFPLVGGSPGKILPLVLVKGRLAHSCYVMDGLNSAVIAAEIVRNVELCTDLLSFDQGASTQPPAAQMARDLKSHYDVSLPEYSVAMFNVTFLSGTNPTVLLDKLKAICEESVRTVVSRYHKVFEGLGKQGLIPNLIRQDFSPKVIFLDELKNSVLAEKEGFGEFQKAAHLRASLGLERGSTLQEVSVEYVKELVEFSGVAAPAVVIAIAPPYYPAVSNSYLDRDIGPFLSEVELSLSADCGTMVENRPYSQAMTDACYMSCVDPEGSQRVMGNMGLPNGFYSIDCAGISELNVPTLLIGPAGRDVHQVGERVYAPDVDEHIPRILDRMIRLL